MLNSKHVIHFEEMNDNSHFKKYYEELDTNFYEDMYNKFKLENEKKLNRSNKKKNNNEVRKLELENTILPIIEVKSSINPPENAINNFKNYATIKKTRDFIAKEIDGVKDNNYNQTIIFKEINETVEPKRRQTKRQSVLNNLDKTVNPTLKNPYISKMANSTSIKSNLRVPAMEALPKDNNTEKKKSLLRNVFRCFG